MRAASISMCSTKKTPFCLMRSICCSRVGWAFCSGRLPSSASCRQPTWVILLACSRVTATRVISLNCGFANGSKATGLDSLAVEAGGSHAKGCLSFKRAFTALLGLQKRPAALFGTETISLPFHSLSPVISPFIPRASRWQSTGRHSGAGDYLSLRLLKYSIYSFPQTSSLASAFSNLWPKSLISYSTFGGISE